MAVCTATCTTRSFGVDRLRALLWLSMVRCRLLLCSGIIILSYTILMIMLRTHNNRWPEAVQAQRTLLEDHGTGIIAINFNEQRRTAGRTSETSRHNIIASKKRKAEQGEDGRRSSLRPRSAPCALCLRSAVTRAERREYRALYNWSSRPSKAASKPSECSSSLTYVKYSLRWFSRGCAFWKLYMTCVQREWRCQFKQDVRAVLQTLH
jgi:hypothetical protein